MARALIDRGDVADLATIAKVTVVPKLQLLIASGNFRVRHDAEPAGSRLAKPLGRAPRVSPVAGRNRLKPPRSSPRGPTGMLSFRCRSA